MYVLLKRKLKDYDSWKSIVSEGSARKEMGSKGLTVYRTVENPNEVYIILEWDDSVRTSYQDYLNLPEVKKALAESGTTKVIEISESFHLES
jgi:heme-degrading monooxygenase HmoA